MSEIIINFEEKKLGSSSPGFSFCAAAYPWLRLFFEGHGTRCNPAPMGHPKISEQALKEWDTSETCAIKVSMRL